MRPSATTRTGPVAFTRWPIWAPRNKMWARTIPSPRPILASAARRSVSIIRSSLVVSASAVARSASVRICPSVPVDLGGDAAGDRVASDGPAHDRPRLYGRASPHVGAGHEDDVGSELDVLLDEHGLRGRALESVVEGVEVAVHDLAVHAD